MRVISEADFVSEVSSFMLVEKVRRMADALQQCMECDEPWTSCLRCSEGRTKEREP